MSPVSHTSLEVLYGFDKRAHKLPPRVRLQGEGTGPRDTSQGPRSSP